MTTLELWLEEEQARLVAFAVYYRSKILSEGYNHFPNSQPVRLWATSYQDWLMNGMPPPDIDPGV